FCERVARQGGHPSSYVLAWDALNASGTMYVASGGGFASLDTDFVFRSEPEPEESPPPKKLLLRPRAQSLMELGEVMAFDEWLRIVSIRLASARRVRSTL